MDMRGASRDGLINNRALDDPDRIVIERAPPVLPTTASHPHTRNPSESQNLLPNSPRNLFEYSSTKKYTFDRQDDTQYDPRSIRQINGRESPMWSGVPQTLRKSSRQRWRDLIVDLVAVLASIPFFALASALIWVNGTGATEEKNNSLNQLIKGAATLFPLVFSVVVGRSMIKIASWKLEHGTSLGFLERLLGSRTVGGALITAVGLRSIAVGSVLLVIVWLLSPLGSQSILRILSIHDTSLVSSSNATYTNLRQQNYAGQFQSNSWSNGLAAMISASLLAPEVVKTSTMDIWGNVKIPLFSSLSNISEDENGWRQISQSNFTSVHSSLFGLPISIGDGNSTFQLQSTYMELTCSNQTSDVTRKPSLFIDPGLISTSGPFIAAQNLTSTTAWALGYLGDDTTSLLPNGSVQALDTLSLNDSAIANILPGLLLYQDFTGTRNVTSVYCVPSQVYVESNVTCTTSRSTTPSCAVTAQRLSLLPHLPSAITLLSISNLFLGLSSMLPAATPQLNHIDIMQNYIYSPLDNSFIQSTPYPMIASPPGGESRFLNLSLSDFGVRLGQILNAFLEGSTMNYTTYLTSSSQFSSSNTSQPLASSPQNLTTQIQQLEPFLSVPGTTSITTPTFNISYLYLALFLLSTTVLLFSAILSLFLSQLTRLPASYLTHLSSLLRDSPFLPEFPTGGVQLDGLRRARELGHMQVRLGDVGNVNGGYEIGVGAAVVVGRIGIGLVEGDGKGTEGVRELVPGRMYL